MLLLGGCGGGGDGEVAQEETTTTRAVTSTAPVGDPLVVTCERWLTFTDDLVRAEIGPRAAREELAAITEEFALALEEDPANLPLGEAADMAETVNENFDPGPERLYGERYGVAHETALALSEFCTGEV